MNIQFLRGLQNMILNMVSRCVLAVASDSGGLQKVQIRALAGETLNDVDRFQNYGLTSHPKPGAQGVMVTVAGSRDGAVVIAMDDNRYRVKLEAGEVALYDDQGQTITLKRGRIIDVQTDELRINATNRVVFNTPEIETNGQIIADGRIESSTDVLGNGTSLHNHTHTGDDGGSTSPPN